MTEAKDMIHDIFDKSGLRTEYGCVIEKDDLASFFCGSVIDPLDRFEGKREKEPRVFSL